MVKKLTEHVLSSVSKPWSTQLYENVTCDAVCYVFAVNSHVTSWTLATRTREATSSVSSATRRLTKSRRTAPVASLRRRRHLDPALPSRTPSLAAKFKRLSARLAAKARPAAGARPSTGVRRPTPWTRVIRAGRRRTSSAPGAAHLFDVVTSHPVRRHPGTRSTLCGARRSAVPAITPAVTRSCVITIIITSISSRRRSSWRLTSTISFQTATLINSCRTMFARRRVSRAPATI